MKKLLVFFLILCLVLTGLFLWKGGHHAIVLSELMEDWLDEDHADHHVLLSVQSPGFSVNDRGEFEPEVRQLVIGANTFRTEYQDRDIYGLTTDGITVYFQGGNLYMDSGKAYALPKSAELAPLIRKLAFGFLRYGRMRKTGDVYQLTMKSPELEFSASIQANHQVQSITLAAAIPEKLALNASITPGDPAPHPLPQQVIDAMVHAKMEPPMELSKPLQALLPALQTLLPLEGDLQLGVECGILNLSETLGFSLNDKGAALLRDGVRIDLKLPQMPDGFSPAAAGLLLLGTSDFTQDGTLSQFRMDLNAELTTQIVSALVPQAGNLGIRFSQSEALISIDGARLSAISMTAQGSVPFLVTEIPLSFSAQLNIQ